MRMLLTTVVLALFAITARGGEHVAVVAIEGNHLADIGEVFKKCKYVVEKSSKVKTGKEASREFGRKLDGDRVTKVAYFASGWTFIIDPELVISTNDIWLEYSGKWKTRVIGWLIEDTSGTFGLTVFKSGKKEREIISVDGDIKVNEGKALTEEAGMKWKEPTATGLMDIAKRLGAKYDYPADREYTVFQLKPSKN
jgi:hypothetical protein